MPKLQVSNPPGDPGPSTRSRRRSARLKTALKVSEAHDDVIEYSEEENQERVDKPPRKRQKKRDVGKAKGKGRTRKLKSLSRLLEMPFDILFEIFGHLHPIDLVHLARTSKEFRMLLMGPSAKSIWIQARAQFVDMMTVFQTVPCRNIKPAAMIPSDERKDYVERLAALVAPLPDGDERLSALETEMMEKARKIEEHAEGIQDFIDVQGTSRIIELETLRLHRRLAIANKLSEHGLGEEIPKMSQSELREFMDLPCMKQPKELTERIWDNIKDDVLDYVTKFHTKRLVIERSERLNLPFMLLVLIFKTSMPVYHDQINPYLADFCLQPQVIPFLHEFMDGHFSLGSEEIVEAKAQQFYDGLDDFLAEWHTTTDNKLLDLLPENMKEGIPDAMHALQLSTVWFSCPLCNEKTIPYPRIKAHRCLMKCRELNLEPATLEDDLRNLLYRKTGEAPWSSENLVFDAKSSELMGHLVELCGLDPKTTTAEDLDNLDPRFACLACSDDLDDMSSCCAITWRRAPVHAHTREIPGDNSDPEVHFQKSSWNRLTDEQAKAVKVYESREESEMDFRSVWSCMRCRSLEVFAKVDLEFHYEDIHDVYTILTEGVDYALSQDAYCSYKAPFEVALCIDEKGDFLDFGPFYSDEEEDDEEEF
ncbi:hypothetical protein C8Q75DRAFT_801540 [Abortiporus biennis]|nr:hypothetical protein C8Q75DRAFT_801540 [Abortiporus biennis]